MREIPLKLQEVINVLCEDLEHEPWTVTQIKQVFSQIVAQNEALAEHANDETIKLTETKAERDSLKQQVAIKDEALEIAVKALEIVQLLKSEVHWIAPNNRDKLRTLLNEGNEALNTINKLLGRER